MNGIHINNDNIQAYLSKVIHNITIKNTLNKELNCENWRAKTEAVKVRLKSITK